MPYPRFEPQWGKLIPFVLVHVAAVAALPYTPFEPWLVGLAAGLYVLRMLGVTMGYHRYFSHKSFKTSRAMQLLLALLANTTLMRGPLTWAAAHRYHHKHSDTEADLHSPTRRGVLWAHTLWFVSKEYDRTELALVRDLEAYPELVWLNRLYFLPAYGLGAGLWLGLGWPAFVWGFLVSTVVTWHGVFTINSLSHVFGTHPYDTGDDSKNNPVLAIITLGEGWHNNHHYNMLSARQGWLWWQYDPTWWVLVVLEKLGLVWDLYPPPKELAAAPPST